MNKAITAAFVAVALTLGASQAMAADDAKDDTKMAPDTNMSTETGPGAGTTPGQSAGTETSDRTPEKTTPTPDSQTTKTDGETSDRTPDKDGSTK